MKVSIIQLLTQSYSDILPWYLGILPIIFVILFVIKSLSNNIFFYIAFSKECEDDGLKIFALGMFSTLYVIIFLIAIFYKFPIIIPTT